MNVLQVLALVNRDVAEIEGSAGEIPGFVRDGFVAIVATVLGIAIYSALEITRGRQMWIGTVSDTDGRSP